MGIHRKRREAVDSSAKGLQGSKAAEFPPTIRRKMHLNLDSCFARAMLTMEVGIVNGGWTWTTSTARS